MELLNPSSPKLRHVDGVFISLQMESFGQSLLTSCLFRPYLCDRLSTPHPLSTHSPSSLGKKKKPFRGKQLKEFLSSFLFLLPSLPPLAHPLPSAILGLLSDGLLFSIRRAEFCIFGFF